MDQWIGTRFKKEISSIASLASYIKETIENEENLLFRLKLETGIEFVVDLSVITLERPPTPPPPPPVENLRIFLLFLLFISFY